MKNKKLEQAQAKQTHIDTLRSKRKVQAVLQRAKPELNIKPTILIVCEGQNTEPSYFKQFRLSSATITTYGSGSNTVSLVQKAIKLSKEKSYDQIWCVFDADPKPDNPKQATNFNEAIQLAEKKKFGIAYSNQAFEYWLILHFDDHQGAKMDRSDYNHKINQLLAPFGLVYDGKTNKKIIEAFFEVLNGIDEKTGKERKHLAIIRAERIYKRFDHVNPSDEESSTTVFRLVRELLKHV